MWVILQSSVGSNSKVKVREKTQWVRVLAIKREDKFESLEPARCSNISTINTHLGVVGNRNRRTWKEPASCHHWEERNANAEFYEMA